MGSLITAACSSCGLTANLALGGGMQSFTTEALAPAGCSTCRSVVAVNLLNPGPFTCSTNSCSGTPNLLGGLDANPAVPLPTDKRDVFEWRVGEGKYKLPDQNYACPKCGELSLRFTLSGFWD
jgi:hypothetical protein